MRKWVIRLGALYVFDYIVIVVMGMAMPRVDVGPIKALWAALLLAVGTIWIKPLVRSLFDKLARDDTGQRSRFVGWLVRSVVVFGVAFVIWYLVVWLSAIDVEGYVWGYVWPPVVLLVEWWLYDAISDRFEAQAAKVYDKAFAPEHPASAAPVDGSDAAEGPTRARPASGRRGKDES